MITSRELLEKINEFREKEYQEKAKAGTLTKKENLLLNFFYYLCSNKQ